MTALFSIFFFALLLLVCGLGVVSMIDPVKPSQRARVVMRVLLLALGTFVGLFAWMAWEMR